MRYLMWRVTAVALDVPLLALGLLAGWRFRLRWASDGRGWTANPNLRDLGCGVSCLTWDDGA